MKCPFSGLPCLNSKDVAVTEISDGEPRKVFLCKDCGSKYLTMPDTEISNMVSQVTSFPDGNITSKTITQDYLNQPCPKCGTTIAQILESQTFGCDMCYEFHNALEGMVSASQRVPVGKMPIHIGKSPSRFNIGDQITLLEEKKRLAIKQEEYEKASILTQAIEELTRLLDGEGSSPE